MGGVCNLHEYGMPHAPIRWILSEQPLDQMAANVNPGRCFDIATLEPVYEYALEFG